MMIIMMMMMIIVIIIIIIIIVGIYLFLSLHFSPIFNIDFVADVPSILFKYMLPVLYLSSN